MQVILMMQRDPSFGPRLACALATPCRWIANSNLPCDQLHTCDSIVDLFHRCLHPLSCGRSTECTAKIFAVELQAGLAVSTVLLTCSVSMHMGSPAIDSHSSRRYTDPVNFSTTCIRGSSMLFRVSPQTSGSESLCAPHSTCACRSASRSAHTCTAQQNRRRCTTCAVRCPVAAQPQLLYTSVLPPLHAGHLQHICAHYLIVLWHIVASIIRYCSCHPAAKPQTLHMPHSKLARPLLICRSLLHDVCSMSWLSKQQCQSTHGGHVLLLG